MKWHFTLFHEEDARSNNPQVLNMCKDSVCTSQRTRMASMRKNIWRRLRREVAVVYCKYHTKHTTVDCGEIQGS